MSRRLVSMLALCPLVALVACGGAKAKPSGPPPTSVDAQLAAGSNGYVDHCVECHGAKGEGSKKAPALVGPKALAEYTTAKDLFTYAKDNMPPAHPASLDDQDYWNIVAFLLNKNGAALEVPLTAANAQSVRVAR